LLLRFRIEKVVHHRDDDGHALHQRDVCRVGQYGQSRFADLKRKELRLAAGMGLYDGSKARLLLDHGADPNPHATFPEKAGFQGNAPTEPLQDVTPLGYARRYPDRRCVNAPALAAIMEAGDRVKRAVKALPRTSAEYGRSAQSVQ
jgi:hypothetical protein